MAYPSKVLVPLPSSSRITSESCVAFWRTDAVSVHSTKKVPTKEKPAFPIRQNPRNWFQEYVI